MKTIGPIKLGSVKGGEDLKKLLPASFSDVDTFIIKPNWFSPHPGNFTDATVLRMLFEALDGDIIVIESYTLEKQDGSLKFTVEGEEVDWRWVLKHPNWGWMNKKGRWTRLREQDQWFLSEFGFQDLFSEFGVEYINITEEVWKGKVLDSALVKEKVEEKFSPVLHDKMYGYLPKKLLRYKDDAFINLGKVKGIGGSYPSLTLKNMFGLIPDPLRAWWHGPDDIYLSGNILDINKIYHTFFDVFGLCEAITSATVSNLQGTIEVPWGGYDVLKDPQFACVSENLLSLDAVMCVLMDINPFSVEYINQGQEEFGRLYEKILNKARELKKDFFSFN
jgi:uncharacterized protein (DUF362 family)